MDHAKALTEEVRPPRGYVTLWNIDERSGLWTPLSRKRNLLMFGWGHIAARQIGFQRDAAALDFAVRGMYIEFENVASPGDPATVPSFTRSDGLEYFDDLSGSPSKDFLRVALRGQPELGIVDGFEEVFTEGEDGNKLSIFAQTAGTTGVHGKTFSDSVNSKVYGAALVARPVFDDRTRDVIFARSYFDVGDQTLKEASSQVGVSWEIEFV